VWRKDGAEIAAAEEAREEIEEKCGECSRPWTWTNGYGSLPSLLFCLLLVFLASCVQESPTKQSLIFFFKSPTKQRELHFLLQIAHKRESFIFSKSPTKRASFSS
jgi:hypothetical protein